MGIHLAHIHGRENVCIVSTDDRLTNILNKCKSNIPSSTIRRLETETEGIPRKERLETIADYFNVSVDYLLGRTEPILTPDKTDEIVREIVKEYNLDLTIPGQREKLESIIKLVVDDYTRK